MKLLLDTHILIWSGAETSRLSKRVTSELCNPENELWLSPVSIWEIVLLIEKKRLTLIADPEEWLQDRLAALPLRQAAMTHEVALQAAKISFPHRDPGDRLLAATAIVYGLTLVTADRHLLACEEIPTLANR